MPDLDQLFVALATHADTIPTGTAAAARRRGQQRRHRRLAAAVAVLLVLGAGAYGVVRIGLPRIEPAQPRPTASFQPLALVGRIASAGAAPRHVTVVDDWVYSVGRGGDGRMVLTTLDLATMNTALAPVDLGPWADTAAFAVLVRPEGLVVTGNVDGTPGLTVHVRDPRTAALRWAGTFAENSVILDLPWALVVQEPDAVLALDWPTGAQLWRRPLSNQELTILPMLTQPSIEESPLAGIPVSDPADPRLLLIDGSGDVVVVDAATGDEVGRFATGVPTRTFDPSKSIDGWLELPMYLAFGGVLYVSAEHSVYAYPVDANGDRSTLYIADESEYPRAVTPCGTGLVCIGVFRASGTSAHSVLIEIADGQEILRIPADLPGVVDDRVLTRNGALYDLEGDRLLPDSRSRYVWWITAGSALLVSSSSRGRNGGEYSDVVGVSTVDGALTELGEVEWPVGGCTIAARRYLVCGAIDRVDVWRFATG